MVKKSLPKKINKKEFPCIETTIEISFGIKRIRIWINKDKIPEDYKYEKKLYEKISKNSNMKTNDLLRFIAKQKDVNAVQIINDDIYDAEYGTIVYTVNFEDDPHG